MIFEIAKSLFDLVFSSFGNRRILRLTVHRAYFLKTSRECYFINATNLSRTREVEITHVWFESTPQLHVSRTERPLPKRLKPDESWETWIEVEYLPAELHAKAHTLARARLSNGSIVKSKRNEKVPQMGSVPGGPI